MCGVPAGAATPLTRNSQNPVCSLALTLIAQLFAELLIARRFGRRMQASALKYMRAVKSYGQFWEFHDVVTFWSV